MTGASDSLGRVWSHDKLDRLLADPDVTAIVYAPIMDRLEAELSNARAAEDPVFRARRLLSAYTIPGGTSALPGVQN